MITRDNDLPFLAAALAGRLFVIDDPLGLGEANMGASELNWLAQSSSSLG
jgi:hypothetical protein